MSEWEKELTDVLDVYGKIAYIYVQEFKQDKERRLIANSSELSLQSHNLYLLMKPYLIINKGGIARESSIPNFNRIEISLYVCGRTERNYTYSQKPQAWRKIVIEVPVDNNKWWEGAHVPHVYPHNSV